MGASPHIPWFIYTKLAKDFDKQPEAVKKDRQKLAKDLRKLYESGDVGADADFNDDDLDCYEALVTLNCAKRCKVCSKGYTEWTKEDHGKGVCDNSDDSIDVDDDE